LKKKYSLLKYYGYLRWQTNVNNIDLEINSYCNLHCFNCDRAMGQAPTRNHMTVSQIQLFVEESIALRKHWKEIKILGGEPTLHPNLFQIIDVLAEYKKFSPLTNFLLITNGYDKNAGDILSRIPYWVCIENTTKTSPRQYFDDWNMAPCDNDQLKNIDWLGGCMNMEFCGLGLNSYGYYLCGSAASIDRVFGFDIGLKNLSWTLKPEDFINQRRKLCRYCGRLSAKTSKAVTEEKISPSWRKAYDRYNKEQPQLTLYKKN